MNSLLRKTIVGRKVSGSRQRSPENVDLYRSKIFEVSFIDSRNIIIVCKRLVAPSGEIASPVSSMEENTNGATIVMLVRTPETVTLF